MIATLKAALRLSGFVLLLLLLVPAHLIDGKFLSRNHHRVPLIFYQLVCRWFGLHPRLHGAFSTTRPTLFVANHTSYLDVFVLGAVLPASFVAKAEVANWPLIGWLAKMQRTVFVERRSSRARTQQDEITTRLVQRDSIVLFPEGTSSDGTRVLPFKSSLFSVAETCAAAGTPLTIQPVSLVCTTLNGLPVLRAMRPFYAWFGDMTLPGHLLRVLSQNSLVIDIVFHSPVTLSDLGSRKALAAHCQNEVSRGVEWLNTGRFLTQKSDFSLPAPLQKQLAPIPPDLA